jgi:hypothetical protein
MCVCVRACVCVCVPADDVRALASRAGEFGGLRRLRLRGVGDECATPLLDLLLAAPR